MTRLFGFSAIGTLLFPIALAGQASQKQGTPEILEKAIAAAAKQRYIGTRIIEFRRNGQPVRYSEIVTRDGANTRIEFPEGSMYEGQIIVETAKERRHFFPDKNEIMVLPPRREEALYRLARIAKSSRFNLSTGAGSSVAGQRTTQVMVKDRDGNVLQRIFIEPRTGLLIKRQVFDAGGAQVGLSQFTTVNLNPRIDPSLFRLERRGAKIIRPVDILRSMARAKGFQAATLGSRSGYNLHFSRFHQADGHEVLVQFYGSDKGRLSLYQTKATLDPAKLSRMGRGQVNVYTWTQAGYALALVGNQDQETLKRLAASVSFGT